MKKLLAVFLALCLSLTGCQKSNNEGALRFDISSFPRSLDPQITEDENSTLILINSMAGLTEVKNDGSVIPVLCRDWEVSNDGRKYTFHLKDDLLWEDESPLTARDFAFSLERVIDPSTCSPHSYKYKNILNAEKIISGELSLKTLGVKAEDDKTLIIKLENPDPYFPALMAEVSSFPCSEEFFKACKGKYGLSPETTLSNGPFYIHSKDNSLLLLKKNKHSLYPAREEKLYFCVGRGDGAEIFSEGRSEACIVPFNKYDMIKDYPLEAFFNRTFAFMISPSSPIGENPVYRQIIMETVMKTMPKLPNDTYMAATGIIPPSVLFDDVNYREKAGDEILTPQLSDGLSRDMLIEEIKNSEDGEFPRAEIFTDENEPNFSISSLVQKKFSDLLSLYINIQPLPSRELFNKISSGGCSMALGEIIASGNSPEDYLIPFMNAKTDEEGNTVGTLLSEFYQEENPDKKLNLLKEAEEALIKNHYVLPLYHAPTYFVTASNTEGIKYLGQKQAVYFGDAQFIKK